MTLQRLVLVLTVTLSFVLTACGSEEAPPQPSETAEYPTDPETGDRLCGGIAGFSCGEEEYCQFAEGTCNIADNMGVCRPHYGVCTRDYRPVCGCDGKTYSNACTAASFHVSLAHQGPCAED